ncbi:histidine phosphatase family protein [Anaerolineales bacterium HSG24]|nr:histidine phosphatase family protein [Anaerolineales bacterium HSG24]
MKTILILRHAKSDWSDPNLDDFDRPLNKRGLSDAPRMGKVLLSAEQIPDRIISSPARRAKQTAKLVAEACNYKGSIQWEDAFYGAGSADLIAALKQLPLEVNMCMLIGHNPTMEETVASLCTTSAGISPWGNVDGSDFSIIMPTSGLACLQVDIDDWADLKPGIAILKWFIIPRLIKTIQ